MLNHRLPRLLSGLLALCLFLVLGCAEKKGAPVSGKLIMPAKLKLVETDSVEINFVPDAPKAKGATSEVNAKEGTFVTNTATTKGLMPGKYKVVVKVTPYAGMADSAKRAPLFEDFNKKYALDETKLTFDMVDSKDPVQVTVDLIKNTVTKN